MPNDIMIQWGHKTFTVSVENAWSNLYETATSYSFGNWSQPFSDTPVVTFSNNSGQPIFIEGITNLTKTTIGTTYFWCAKQKNNIPIIIGYIGIGEWE